MALWWRVGEQWTNGKAPNWSILRQIGAKLKKIKPPSAPDTARPSTYDGRAHRVRSATSPRTHLNNCSLNAQTNCLSPVCCKTAGGRCYPGTRQNPLSPQMNSAKRNKPGALSPSNLANTAAMVHLRASINVNHGRNAGRAERHAFDSQVVQHGAFGDNGRKWIVAVLARSYASAALSYAVLAQFRQGSYCGLSKLQLWAQKSCPYLRRSAPALP
jgi:hypothetical protein